MFNRKTTRGAVLLSLLMLFLATGAVAVVGNYLTQGEVTADEDMGNDLSRAEVVAGDRDFTYTTAEDVAAGRRIAKRYLLIDEVAAGDRDFTYTTAESVARGKATAEAYLQNQESE